MLKQFQEWYDRQGKVIQFFVTWLWTMFMIVVSFGGMLLLFAGMTFYPAIVIPLTVISLAGITAWVFVNEPKRRA